MKSADVARLVVAIGDAATTAEKRSAVEFLRTVCQHDGDLSHVGKRRFCGACGAERGGAMAR